MSMIKRSLKNPDAFFGIEENSEKNCYGCEQEWYDSDNDNYNIR